MLIIEKKILQRWDKYLRRLFYDNSGEKITIYMKRKRLILYREQPVCMQIFNVNFFYIWLFRFFDWFTRTTLPNGYIKMLLNYEPSLDDWKKKVETIIRNWTSYSWKNLFPRLLSYLFIIDMSYLPLLVIKFWFHMVQEFFFIRYCLC